jgi:type III pantothenate kinase
MSKGSVLVIDAGNTAVKVGIFRSQILVDTQRFNTIEFLKDPLVCIPEDYEGCTLSSVLNEEGTSRIVNALNNCMVITNRSFTGLQIKYDNPEKLGIDRICNAAAVRKIASSVNAVSIDIGTCIKFDLVSGNEYLGGSISPGIDLRYRSLKDYTDNLPLLSDKKATRLVGNSTETSIRSGVINGIQAEINGLMERYIEEFGDLTFFVTGGDAPNFDIEGKNNIFADENLTLKGLYYIYLANVH